VKRKLNGKMIDLGMSHEKVSTVKHVIVVLPADRRFQRLGVANQEEPSGTYGGALPSDEADRRGE